MASVTNIAARKAETTAECLLALEGPQIESLALSARSRETAPSRGSCTPEWSGGLNNVIKVIDACVSVRAQRSFADADGEHSY